VQQKDRYPLFRELLTHQTAEERLEAIAISRKKWWYDKRDHQAKQCRWVGTGNSRCLASGESGKAILRPFPAKEMTAQPAPSHLLRGRWDRYFLVY
jgi:hypothetical protein